MQKRTRCQSRRSSVQGVDRDESINLNLFVQMNRRLAKDIKSNIMTSSLRIHYYSHLLGDLSQFFFSFLNSFSVVLNIRELLEFKLFVDRVLTIIYFYNNHRYHYYVYFSVMTIALHIVGLA